jgi:hypothetical protein
MDFIQQARNWRKRLGFSSQAGCRDFLGGKTVRPEIDEAYLSALNQHLQLLMESLNGAVHPGLKLTETGLQALLHTHGEETLATMRSNGLLPRLNNQGRRPEEVFFNWMRGYLVAQYFLPVISRLFEPLGNEVRQIGEDDFNDPSTFRRSGTADLAILKSGVRKAYIEVQSGFSGINDLKRHKWVEARTKLDEEGLPSFIIHFDLFNGAAALLNPLDYPVDGDLWVQRQQMEGQWVLPLDPNWFLWDLQSALSNSYDELIPE